MKIIRYLVIFLSLFNYHSLLSQPIKSDSLIFTGFRASRILSSYPDKQFPSKFYWTRASQSIATKFENSQPAGIWIVSLCLDDGSAHLSFPRSEKYYRKIKFSDEDYNEEYLSYFDKTGVDVWLQVEPGGADVETLISLVLNRYKHHPCVRGFGVDIEWYYSHIYKFGKKLSDTIAARWEKKVKEINPEYTLFLKHFGIDWMPPKYRGDIIFIDDSQMFINKDELVREFQSWGKTFYPNVVCFQFGYPADRFWWLKFQDPFWEIGNDLVQTIPNCKGLFWVDFTLEEIFPKETFLAYQHNLTNSILLNNFPNLFDQSTKISVYIPPDSDLVSLEVFDMNGEQVATLMNNEKLTGLYQLKFEESALPNGIYFCKLKTGNYLQIAKMILLK